MQSVEESKAEYLAQLKKVRADLKSMAIFAAKMRKKK